MAIEKLVQFQITDVEKDADCSIQIHRTSPSECMALGGRRCMAVSANLYINKKSYSIGFVPDYTYWDAVPIIVNTFKLAYQLGKRIGANQLQPDDKLIYFPA